MTDMPLALYPQGLYDVRPCGGGGGRGGGGAPHNDQSPPSFGTGDHSGESFGVV